MYINKNKVLGNVIIIFFIELYKALNGFFSAYTISGIHKIPKKEKSIVPSAKIKYQQLIAIICDLGNALISFRSSWLERANLSVESSDKSIVPIYLETKNVIP